MPDESSPDSINCVKLKKYKNNDEKYFVNLYCEILKIKK